MITIGSSSGFFSNTQAMGNQRPQRHDPGKLVDEIFAKLDTKGQGYLEKSDLQSAFEASSSGKSASVDEIFSSLDGDGDGKITKDEMSSGLKKLAEELDNQFNAGRLAKARGNMPPPPPAGDAGFSKEQLSTQLDEATTAGDSQRADLLDAIVNNFSDADSNGDGKVSFQEAIAYDQSRQSQESSTNQSATADSIGARVLHEMMRLAAAYRVSDTPTTASTLSVSA